MGPGPAVGIWTQFCSVGCAGCMSKDTWERGKIAAEPKDVAAWANSLDRRFLVLSGGEPFDQAEACCELIDACRAER
ncbi:MAG: 4Fe-4S cluster-binding domain-containing protein, partial [Acidimicrobiales bacterium]|nr:4Fe-4S cluster-binding domain-containing protein [Acidimicrobiales bacterium]